MYSIRRAVADDAEEILRYCKIIGTGTDNLTFGAEGIGVSVENERQYLQNVFDSENDLYVIAEENCEIVGVCGLSSYKKERLAHRAKISLSVRKQMCGNRIGSELLRKSLEFSGKTKKIEIVSRENEHRYMAAVSLYQKFGFEIVGIFGGFIKINEGYIDCYIMTLKLCVLRDRKNELCFT